MLVLTWKVQMGRLWVWFFLILNSLSKSCGWIQEDINLHEEEEKLVIFQLSHKDLVFKGHLTIHLTVINVKLE